LLPLPAQIALYSVAMLFMWMASWRLKTARYRQLLFLFVSYILYATWGIWFVGLLVLSSMMNYGLGNYLRRNPTSTRLWLAVILNVALLSTFKYLPLIATFVHNSPLAVVSRIVMPIGMSFWTFQALSYLFDLYREEELDPSLLEFFLYMAFWPTVLSGPICRMPSMLPQFRQRWARALNYVSEGAHRMIIGALMIPLSQLLTSGLRRGQGVDSAFALPAQRFGGLDVWILIIGYGFQLFFNFCGYSHLVMGAARLFGFKLHENFNRPFLSRSTSEFWTRWHMSLSFWIRDYVFFPLATVRPEVWWRNLSLIIAMLVFGLWHKGSILFMIWGIYHGLLLVLHRLWQRLESVSKLKVPPPIKSALAWPATFAGISIGWIFFRAEDLRQAADMLRLAFSPGRFLQLTLPIGFYWLVLTLAAGYFLVVAAANVLDRWANKDEAVRTESNVSWAFHILSQERWVWAVPLSTIISLYLLLLLHPRVTAVYPTLYGMF
jgi:alginate O-acetyltransferase complex protein AlgI